MINIDTIVELSFLKIIKLFKQKCGKLLKIILINELLMQHKIKNKDII